jgi:hypothetical protein
MTINEERQLGRAKNASLSFLEQRLSVPKIYIDAEWAGTHVDILAINRDGVGDVHAVILFALNLPDKRESIIEYLTLTIEPLIEKFHAIPAQYKYIAAVDVSGQGDIALPGIPPPLVDKSFSPDGIGRIGFLTINFPAGREPQVQVDFKPERFRAAIAKLADDYIQHHEADWEIRA